MAIDKNAWQNAQDSEFNDHVQNTNVQESLSYFNNYFNLFGDQESCYGKKILEVGSGVFPLGFFLDWCDLTVVEPLYDKFDNDTKDLWKDKNVKVVPVPFEEMQVGKHYDEVWFINFLQHTIDPQLCLEKVKDIGVKIRVFEPINTPTNLQHPHSLTVKLFEDVYPEAEIKIYTGGSIPSFHTADCCYFVY